MAPSRSTTKETASEIARRYSLEDLSKARAFARRYHINALASKAFTLFSDLVPTEEELDSHLLPRYLRHPFYHRPSVGYLREFPILPRRSLPSLATRILYDKRLAEHVAERKEALKRTDALHRYYLDRYDPLNLLDGFDYDDIDLDLEDDNAGNEGTSAQDKNEDGSNKDNTASASTERTTDPFPALLESRNYRRHRYPRLSAEAVYRILEAGL